MRPTCFWALVLCAALQLVGSPARAQSFTIGGGLALPTDNTVDSGFQVQGSVELPVANPALAIRLDAQYNRFPFTYTPALPCTSPGCSPQHAHQRMIAGMVGGVLQLPDRTSPLTPYLVAGIGAYNHSTPPSRLPSGTDFGVNAGGGVRLVVGAAQLVLEARMHIVKNTTNFVPIVVGLRF